jgi:hypothetical protein
MVGAAPIGVSARPPLHDHMSTPPESRAAHPDRHGAAPSKGAAPWRLPSPSSRAHAVMRDAIAEVIASIGFLLTNNLVILHQWRSII